MVFSDESYFGGSWLLGDLGGGLDCGLAGGRPWVGLDCCTSLCKTGVWCRVRIVNTLATGEKNATQDMGVERKIPV